jgi:hypothetical protein
VSRIISAAGDGDHSRYWTERRANRQAKNYFEKYYNIRVYIKQLYKEFFYMPLQKLFAK